MQGRPPSTFRIVWGALDKRERRIAIGLLIGNLLTVVMETLSVGLILPVAGILTSADYSTSIPVIGELLRSGLSREVVVMLALVAILIAYVIKSLLLASLSWVQRGFMADVSTRISSQLFANYMNQPYLYHLEHNSSTLIRNSQNASLFVSGVIDPLSTLFADVLVGVGLFALMLVVEPLGTLIVGFVFGTAGFVFQRITSKRIKRWGDESQDYAREVIQHLNQGLAGVKDVKILGKEVPFVSAYSVNVAQVSNLQRLYKFLQSLPRLWLEIITVGALCVLVGLLIVQGKDVDSALPVIGLFAATTFRVMPSVHRVVSSAQTLSFNRKIIREIHTDLRLSWDTERVVSECPSFVDKIELNSVGFKYPRSVENVLDDVSIKIARGASIGIVGPSGAGKSTLVDLILGLLYPTHGKITVDGFDIGNDPPGWRSQIGYVPQTIYLTDDSIAKNVAFGVDGENLDRVAVRRALDSAMLSEFVDTLPEGMETIVGERGVRLSGGQRQRLGIARALYRNPSVLVLDEATSSLDIDTERGVMEAVESLHGEKTIIVIAHRLSTIRYCDRVFKFEYGKIVAQGTYEQVLGESN